MPSSLLPVYPRPFVPLAAFSLLCVVSSAAAAQTDTPPTTPAGITARAYSGTAGGIRWQRSSDDRGPVVGYEIARDGRVLGVFDTLSYVERSLAPGTSYRYVVVAIDNAGQRSGQATVTLRTLGGDGVGDAPAAPSGLRAEVYSRTAAELFWTRPTTFGLVYEVQRDGTAIATTDGTSYFDDTLAGGTTYRYELIAIDRSGRRSSASGVTLTTRGTGDGPPPSDPFELPDPDGPTAIARLGYVAARDYGDVLVSGDYLDLYFDVDEALAEVIAGAEGLGVTRPCPGGGSLVGAISPGGQQVARLELDACVVDERTLSGTLVREIERFPIGVGSVSVVTIRFEELEIVAEDGRALRVSGSAERRVVSASSQSCPNDGALVSTFVENRIDSARYETEAGVANVTASSYEEADERQWVPLSGSTERPPRCVERRALSFAGEAAVASPDFGGVSAQVEKSGELATELAETPTTSGTARLAASFDDGSSLVVTAMPATGEDAVQIDIVSEAVTVSFVDEFRFRPSSER